MNHGVSFLEVDNSKIQEAIANNKPKDIISRLKQEVAWFAVYGFEYDEVSFEQLGNLLTHDYGFTPFKYASVEEGAIYDTIKHPEAWGRVRGRANVNDVISWLCLDVDDSTITAEEMHQILANTNHHIARTSNKDNPYKFRVIVELTTPVTVTESLWKFFIKAVATSLGIDKLDALGRSAVIYGYKDRKVYSVLDKGTINTSRHLKMAQTKVAELEEKRATALPAKQQAAALQSPYNTFGFAYDAEPGEGTNKMLAAIHKAKELGATKEYIVDLLKSINRFWDHSMPAHRLQSTVMTAI